MYLLRHLLSLQSNKSSYVASKLLPGTGNHDFLPVLLRHSPIGEYLNENMNTRPFPKKQSVPSDLEWNRINELFIRFHLKIPDMKNMTLSVSYSIQFKKDSYSFCWFHKPRKE